MLLNKWELLDADAAGRLATRSRHRLGFLGYAPVLKISALTGKGVSKLLPALADAIERYHAACRPASVNQRDRRARQAAQPGAGRRARALRPQGATDPPTFTLFANRELPPTYLRYLERKIREAFDLGPTPIKLRVRRRSA